MGIKTCISMARLAFIAELLRDYRPFTASSVARKLEVSRKAIQRDLEFMRDRLHWPIEFDHQMQAYELTGPPPPPATI